MGKKRLFSGEKGKPREKGGKERKTNKFSPSGERERRRLLKGKKDFSGLERGE